MKKLCVVFLGLAIFLVVQPARADTSSCVTTALGAISCTGNFGTPEGVFEEAFTVSGGPTAITIQTYGFGGSGAGTNAAGQSILAGGFDSMVALFSGTGPTTTILLDAFNNPIASVPGTTQFSSGCPPAGFVSIGPASDCGDNTLSATLLNGTYTLLLSDANFVPFAVNPGPPISSLLSDGFGDLTGGVFQTCDTNGSCITDNGNFAVDILGLPPAPTPEPATLLLLGSGILGMSWRRRRASRSASSPSDVL